MLPLQQLKMNSESNILRNIIFPKENICPKTELYYRTVSGGMSENKLNIRGTAVFDTYFNSFPLGKYLEYCIFSGLYLKLKVCGIFNLRIFGVNSDEETLVLEKNINAQGITEDVTDISGCMENDFSHIYFSLESENGILYGGNFYCTADNFNDINTAVVICTFKREKFLLRNHIEICEYLENQDILNKDNIHFYIVDNGRTLDKDVIENAYTTLVPNNNTGGSGGFTRGYYEALHSGKNYTNILFMDDDIVLDGEMLLRVYGILRTAKDKDTAVGGVMIKLSDFITQHEAGAIWNGKKLTSLGNGADLTKRENVFSEYPKCNYNAWWFYCFPSDWQSKYGYPLQFFIKEDDIEYSLRCAEKITVMSGIAVWHDDFEGKYDGFQEYYIKRNELILTSVNDQKPYPFFQVEKLVKCVMRQVVYQRYFLADIVIRAYDDYLKGWENFRNTDTEKLNIELMNSCQSLLTDDELKEYNVYFDKDKYEYALNEQKHLLRQILTFNGYFIPKCFYKKDKDGFSIVPLAGCKFINFYRHKKILHYDISRKKGFVTEMKNSLFWKYCFLLLGKSIKFLLKYPSVRKGYKKHLKELSDFSLTDE